MPLRSLAHRAPSVWLLLPLMLGLILGKLSPRPLSVGFALGLGLLALAAALWARGRHPRLWAGLLLGGLVAVGVARYELERAQVPAWDSLPPREAQVVLRVDRTFPVPPDQERASGLGTLSVVPPLLAELAGQRVYFSVNLPPGQAPASRSAHWEMIGVLQPLPRHPPDASFDAYLAGSGINFKLTRARWLSEPRPARAYYRFCDRALQHLGDLLGRGLSDRPELSRVLRAMMLGQKHELAEEQNTLFLQSGTLHLFAISGLHIAVIALGLHTLLSVLRLPPLARFLAGLGLLWLYVDITGGTPSAVRAFLMVTLFQAAFQLRLVGNPLSALSTSALLVLLLAPLQLFSASFQMSYGIVASLLLLGLPLAERAQARWALFRDLPPAAWGYRQRFCAALWSRVLLAACLGFSTTPVSAITGVLFFQLFTPGALAANLVLIPLASLVILAGSLSLLCGLIGLAAGSVLFNHAAGLVLALMEALIRGFLTVPGMFFPLQFPAAWWGGLALMLVMATLLAGYVWRWERRRGGIWPPFAVVALAIGLGAWGGR